MDPALQSYLLKKYGQTSNANMSPADAFQSNLQQSQPDQNFDPLDPTNSTDTPPPPPAPPVQAKVAPDNNVPTVPPIDKDVGTLSDDELARYGIRTPNQVAALQQQRIQMGNDVANQSNQNALAKILAQASDNISATGNRLIAGNPSNNAPGIGKALDDSLQGKQAQIQAFDDANEKVGQSDYNRLKDIDDKRLKIQQLRDASEDRNASLGMRQKELDAWRKSTQDARNDRFSTEQDRKLDERVSRFGKSLSSLQSGARNAIGRSANTFLDSQAVLALAGTDAKQYDKLTPQQVYEVARAYDRVVSRGSPTSSATAHLIPKSALMSAANFNQWLSSSPANSNVGGLVKTMVDGSKREGAVAKAIADRAAGTVLQSYSDLKNKRPEQYYNILAARDQELGGSDVNQVLQNAGVPQFGQPSASQQPGGLSVDPNAIKAEMQRRGL